ncbi:MAG: DNA-binding protein [Myxococcales bacterium]|nr:DNA-binding protein [Myxococcales bacterium]
MPTRTSVQTWLTTLEAAQYCRLGAASTIRGLVQRGEFVPDGRAGRRGSYLFRRETLDAWLQSCAGHAAARTLRPSVAVRPADLWVRPGEDHEEKQQINDQDPRRQRVSAGRRQIVAAGYRKVPQDQQVAGGDQDAASGYQAGRSPARADPPQGGPFAGRGNAVSQEAQRQRLLRAVARGQERSGQAAGGSEVSRHPVAAHPA